MKGYTLYTVTYSVQVELTSSLDPDHYPPEIDAPLARAWHDAELINDGSLDPHEMVECADRVKIIGVTIKKKQEQ